MNSHEVISNVRKAKQDLVNTITEKYNKDLFGTPPSVTESGKLTGSTPPDMSLISKLYS